MADESIGITPSLKCKFYLSDDSYFDYLGREYVMFLFNADAYDFRCTVEVDHFGYESISITPSLTCKYHLVGKSG